MKFVFDRKFHTVPDEGDICSGFYYEKAQYLSNVASGVADEGFLGHGSLFIDIFHSGTPYETILTEDITDEDDLLYLIEPWPMFNGAKEKEKFGSIARPVNWNLTLKLIPERIIELAQEGRLLILLHIPEFTSGLPLIKKNITNTLKHLKIPAKQFKFISGIRDRGWYYWPGFEYSQLQCYNGMDVVQEVNLKKRKKKYTCLNRIDKSHRRYTAVSLWKRNLAKCGFLSYGFRKFTYEGLQESEWHDDPAEYDPIEWDIPLYEWKRFSDSRPWSADELTVEEHNHHWHVEKQHYDQAYWNFVTETGCSNVPFLSEKTFKPIANLQPFIILGDKGSLKLLQDLGYKTFGDYIDESYDKIEVTDTRIRKATRQAIELARMSHKEHVKLMHEIKPILEHNQQHFFKAKHRFEKFVKYIYGNKPAYNWLKDC